MWKLSSSHSAAGGSGSPRWTSSAAARYARRADARRRLRAATSANRALGRRKCCQVGRMRPEPSSSGERLRPFLELLQAQELGSSDREGRLTTGPSPREQSDRFLLRAHGCVGWMLPSTPARHQQPRCHAAPSGDEGEPRAYVGGAQTHCKICNHYHNRQEVFDRLTNDVDQTISGCWRRGTTWRNPCTVLSIMTVTRILQLADGEELISESSDRAAASSVIEDPRRGALDRRQAADRPSRDVVLRDLVV